MTLLNAKTLLLLMLSFLISNCAGAPPKPAKFYGKWKYCEIVPQEELACLSKDDVKLLKTTLNECGGK